MGIVGYVDAAAVGHVRGWVYQTKRPRERLSVEILRGEQVIATVQADEFREDLRAAGMGDGRHGFSLHLSESRLGAVNGAGGQGQVLSARVKGSRENLSMAVGAIVGALPEPPTYALGAPSDQNALDLFAGEWSTQLPAAFGHLKAGKAPMCEDTRATYAMAQLGGIEGQSVLELGPLEGGHSYLLERLGAREVIGVEANPRAYLRCLVLKEILGMRNVRFLCGDFREYLEQTDRQFDLIFCAGVLYHMKDPVRLLELVARHTRRVYLWTHYFDEKIIRGNPQLTVKFPSAERRRVGNVELTLHRQEYQSSLQQKGFCGGSDQYSYWMEKPGLLAILQQLGFGTVKVFEEVVDHPHGPCACITAMRT